MIGKNIVFVYLLQEYCEVGCKFNVEYFFEIYLVEVVGVGYVLFYDLENIKLWS